MADHLRFDLEDGLNVSDLKDQSERHERALHEIENEHDREIIVAREDGDLKRGNALQNAVEQELKDAGLL